MYQSALKTWLAASSGVTQPSGAQKQSTSVAATKTQKKGESASLQAAERIMKMSLTASKKSDKDTTLSHESLAHAVRPLPTFVMYNRILSVPGIDTTLSHDSLAHLLNPIFFVFRCMLIVLYSSGP